MAALNDLLAQMPNPFGGAHVDDQDIYAWPEGAPDVESLQGAARQALRDSVARARLGRSPFVLMTGEAGEGRTHLVAWLGRLAPGAFLFAAVPPLGDARTPFRHVLRHLMHGLRQQGAAPSFDSSLSHLVWAALRAQAADVVDAARAGSYQGAPDLPAALLPLCEDPDPRDAAAFAAAAGPVWAEVEAGLLMHMLALPSEHPIDGAVRAVLVKYPHAELRGACAAWLAGEGEPQIDRLGAGQHIDGEAAARRVLTGMCRLSPLPVVLAFDQVETAVERLGEPGIRALADLWSALHQEDRLGQVVSCTAEAWAPLSERVGRQLRAERIALSQLDAGQVRELALARLERAFAGGPPRPGPAYPFGEGELAAVAKTAPPPSAREALRRFAEEFERRRERLLRQTVSPQPDAAAPPVSEAQVVDGALASALVQLHGRLGETPPATRGNVLRAVIKELCDGLRQHPAAAGGHVLSCDPILGGGMRLQVQLPGTGPNRLQRAAIEVCNADVGPAVFSVMSRLARQVSDGKAELALLLREEGLPLQAGLARTPQPLEAQLGGRGGVLWVSESAAVELLAIDRLLRAAAAGEIVAGGRPLGRAEVVGWLLQRPALPRLLQEVLSRLRPEGTEEAAGQGSPASREDGGGVVEAPAAPAKSTRIGLGVVPLAPASKGAGAVVPRPAEPQSSVSQRPTLGRLEVVPMRSARELTAQQVLEAIGERVLVEEGLLARELGIAPDALPSLLQPLEAQGLVRRTLRDGRRVVVRAA